MKIRAQRLVMVWGLAGGFSLWAQAPKVYVANNNSNDVSVIDTGTNTVVQAIKVGNQPLAVAFTPDGSYAYVTNASSRTVSRIVTSTGTVDATIPVGKNPHGVAVKPLLGDYAYVGDLFSQALSKINVFTNVVTTIQLTSANRLAFTPMGDYLYVTGGPRVTVLKMPDDAVVTILQVGGYLRGIRITPDGTRAYVANSNSDQVAVINTDSRSPAFNSLVTTVNVPKDPRDLASRRMGLTFMCQVWRRTSFRRSAWPQIRW